LLLYIVDATPVYIPDALLRCILDASPVYVHDESIHYIFEALHVYHSILDASPGYNVYYPEVGCDRDTGR
jgi:hypothetical protein